MYTKGKTVLSVVLSCSLAFSPLTPVSYAMAQERNEGAVELGGSVSDDVATEQNDELTTTSEGQAVVLGGDTASEAEGQDGQTVEVVTEGDGADKPTSGDASENANVPADQDKNDGDKKDDGQKDNNKSGGPIGYMDANGDNRHEEKSVEVTSYTKTMESSYPYVVRDDVSCKDRVTVKGDVTLVICNDRTLTCPKGIKVDKGAHLHIYRQEKWAGAQAGKLVCEVKSGKVAAISVNKGSELTINGCTVDATCKTNDGAGIGGDNGKDAGKINICGGNITAKSKMNGAGIGGGKNGNAGVIDISGGTVVAEAGDEDGAGIGGGQDGDGGIIYIRGTGVSVAEWDEDGMPIKYDCSTNVTATGAKDGSGIGGGYGEFGGHIHISGSLVTAKGKGSAAGIGGGGEAWAGFIDICHGANVTATGGGGAGIGTGSSWLMDSNPPRIEGGEIEIKDSDVHAVSATGGAGIGGGIFGHVESISISGGNTFAMGGMFLGPGTLSVGFQYAMLVEMASGDWARDWKWLVKLTCAPQLSLIGWIIELCADKPEMIYYTGAGIGGGYHAPSGSISISDNAKVTAMGGMLPPNNILKKLFNLSGAGEKLSFKAPDRSKKSYAVGNGAGYEGRADVKLYDSAHVTATMVDLKLADGHSLDELDDLDLGNFDAAKETMGALMDKNMDPGPDTINNSKEGVKAVTQYNMAMIAPSHAVSFDPNADDTWNMMESQVYPTGAPQPLPSCSFVRDGYTFAGWSTSPDGDVVYKDGESAVFENAGDTTLYAQWNAVPKSDLARFGYTLKFGGSTTDIVYNLNGLTDDPSNYIVTWGFNGEDPGKGFPTGKNGNSYTIAKCSAKQMTDEVGVSVLHKNADGKWDVIKHQQISVKSYCDQVIRKHGKISDKLTDEQAAKLEDLCKAMLDYGAYVQLSCSYRTDCLANQHPWAGDWFNVQDVQLPGTTMTKSPEAKSPQGIKYEDIGLNLVNSEGKDAICIGCEPGASLSDYKISVKDGNGKDLDYTKCAIRSDGHYFVFEFPESPVRDLGEKVSTLGVPAKDLDKKFTVSLTRDGKTLEVGASPMDFMCSKIADEQACSIEADVLRALYNYNQKAKACG